MTLGCWPLADYLQPRERTGGILDDSDSSLLPLPLTCVKIRQPSPASLLTLKGIVEVFHQNATSHSLVLTQSLSIFSFFFLFFSINIGDTGTALFILGHCSNLFIQLDVFVVNIHSRCYHCNDELSNQQLTSFTVWIRTPRAYCAHTHST